MQEPLTLAYEPRLTITLLRELPQALAKLEGG
jgi:hypothetical protein